MGCREGAWKQRSLEGTGGWFLSPGWQGSVRPQTRREGAGQLGTVSLGCWWALHKWHWRENGESPGASLCQEQNNRVWAKLIHNTNNESTSKKNNNILNHMWKYIQLARRKNRHIKSKYPSHLSQNTVYSQLNHKKMNKVLLSQTLRFREFIYVCVCVRYIYIYIYE